MDSGGQPGVEERISAIKQHMPGVYRAIQDKAAQLGKPAYALVRRGLRGEPDCFYAFEGGRVVGTPFCHAVTAEVAQDMVQFGATFVCMWPAAQGSDDGAH